MKTFFCLWALFISAGIALSSCQKEAVNPGISGMSMAAEAGGSKEKPANSWKEIEGLSEGPVFNLGYENGEILALGNSMLFKIDPTSMFAKAEHFGTFSEDYSTTLNQHFFTKFSRSSIFVFSTPNPGVFSTLEMERIDPRFGRFIAMTGCNGKALGISGASTCLTAYSRKGSGEMQGASAVFLLLFRTSLSKSGEVVISDVMTIPVEGLTENDRLLTVFAREDRFIVSFDSKTLVVDANGVYDEVSDDSIFEIIPFIDLLLGFGTDQLLLSRDNGITWNPFSRKAPAHFQYWMQKGFQYQNGLITSSPTAIFRMEIKPDDAMFFIREIPTDELLLDKEHVIYDMIRTEGSLVVATSKGIFFRPLDTQDNKKPH